MITSPRCAVMDVADVRYRAARIHLRAKVKANNFYRYKQLAGNTRNNVSIPVRRSHMHHFSARHSRSRFCPLLNRCNPVVHTRPTRRFTRQLRLYSRHMCIDRRHYRTKVLHKERVLTHT